MKQPRRPRGSEKLKTLTRDHMRRIVAVAHARDLGFVDLVGLAELDPAMAFRGAVIRGADLRLQDLAGFDLTGARLIDCRLAGLDLSRALGVTEATLAGSDRDGTVRLPPAPRDAFWATGVPPSWADDWGHDKYGPWVSFSVPGTQTRQRMRWIPAGELMMGSPEDEPGRFEGESPRHLVTIAQGFWMFETACREELWEAVTGNKPSNSHGPSFPVTGASWTDASDFAERLNGALPGIALELPSEARWEYACRAGTTTPYHFGKRISRKRVRYNRYDGPVEVGGLPPNAWGLHEMHGNVWEWCEDIWDNNYRGAPDDGSARLDPSGDAAVRVIRGGSWRDDARYVRAAFRIRFGPGDRYGNLGFRCARGHGGSGAEVAAPADPARGRKRGAPPSAGDAGAAPRRSGGRASTTGSRTGVRRQHGPNEPD
jgi:formylglycine-generating enzyme required for sulfatase activity